MTEYKHIALTLDYAVTIASSQIIDWNREHCICIYLDAKNHMLHSELISIGTATETLIHPREVFKPAILHSAVKILLLHNHPTGDIYPSKMDKIITKRLKMAGELLQIELIDHLIFNKDNKYYSMDFQNKLKEVKK